MNSKNYIFDDIHDIPEEAETNQINPIIGQKTPIIKPKLDDTFPSLLNLSSEVSFKMQSKNDSFYKENSKINKNYFKYNTLIPIINNNSNFIKCHNKALSNEIFANPKVFNFSGNTQEKEKSHKEEDDNSSYYGDGIIYDGIVNFWNENILEENEKKVIIDDENRNKNEIEEDFYEGYNILNMLQKGKKEK